MATSSPNWSPLFWGSLKFKYVILLTLDDLPQKIINEFLNIIPDYIQNKYKEEVLHWELIAPTKKIIFDLVPVYSEQIWGT